MGQYLLSVIRNPWFQLLFLGLIPIKSQASTNSVLRPCPRSEKSKMRTTAVGALFLDYRSVSADSRRRLRFLETTLLPSQGGFMNLQNLAVHGSRRTFP